MRLRGKLIKWNDDRGFGFITPIRGGEQLFVHIKAFTNQHRRPVGNEFVTYETVSDDRGRLRRTDFVSTTRRLAWCIYRSTTLSSQDEEEIISNRLLGCSAA